MRYLYGRCFGLGNAICAVPAIKALATMGDVDVLIGSGPDDIGAFEVMTGLQEMGMVKGIHRTVAPPAFFYDVAIMAMPYDGRWGKSFGTFNADHVYIGKTRPDETSQGFSSWKSHEAEYQLEIVRSYGYDGPDPDCSFRMRGDTRVRNSVYLGMGYKKDAAGFWAQKHWGNEKYAELIERMLLDEDDDVDICITGDIADVKMTINPVLKMVDKDLLHRVWFFSKHDLKSAFDYISACSMFVGNDTGMAHVAASFGLPCVVYYKMENAWTKSHPWGVPYEAVKGHDHDVTVDEMYQAFRRLRDGRA